MIGVQWFQKNLNPRVHCSVRNFASLVSHWNVVPSGWDFSVSTAYLNGPASISYLIKLTYLTYITGLT